MRKCYRSIAALMALLAVLQMQGFSQRALTAADYQRAEKFMGYNTAQLVDKGSIRPTWIEGEKFWYRNTGPAGSEFILVDPAKGTRAPAFNHQKLAATLTTASGESLDANRLPFQTINFTPDAKFVLLTAARKR